MSLINVENLTFAYNGSYENIFENVSLQIDTDWKLGFIGRNGKGKTTFLKLLMDEEEYSGIISHTVSFDYFPFKITDKTVCTEDVINSICPDVYSWEVKRELALLEVSHDVLHRPFELISNGEQTKIILTALLLKENNFLLIDEPTNHLDIHGRELLSKYLNHKKGFTLVSHDRNFIDSCVDHILSLNRQNIDIVQGNFSSWYYNKMLRDNFEFSENQKLKKEIKRLDAASKEKTSWSQKVESTKYATRNSGLRPDRGYIGHKAEKMMTRAKTLEKRQQSAIEEKSKLLKNIETTEKLKLNQLVYRSEKFVELINLSILYNEKKICENISFSVNRGDRIAIYGKNGSGKSSIIKLIIGDKISYSGNLYLGSGLKISYVPQNTSDISGNLSDYAEKYGIDESLFKAILRKLDFSREQFEKSIDNFSDGQKKKVLIARSLCEKAHLHIWDEPLNFIDIYSRIQIENLIMEYKPTLLFVEHDKSFCDNISTKIINI